MAGDWHHLADWQSLNASAKINLTLNILGQNQAGFHLLHSHVAFCELADRLTIKIADNIDDKNDDMLHVTGAFAYQLEGLAWHDNLIAKALRLLRQHIAIPALQIRLEKNIPSGAGLAGGTADAAAILRFFASSLPPQASSLPPQTSSLPPQASSLPPQTAIELAREIGGDGLCCYHSCAGLMEGTGERFTPSAPQTQQDDIGLVILWAGKSLSTALIYQKFADDQHCTDNIWDDAMPANDWGNIAAGRNDLQDVAERLSPDIAKMTAFIQHHMAGRQEFIRMTGSGSAIYAVFRGTHQTLQDILPVMQADLPAGWFLWAGKLHNNNN